jgi:hypothetical protein
MKVKRAEYGAGMSRIAGGHDSAASEIFTNAL